MCRYFLNGECWGKDKCKFLHDGAKKIEKESIPLCKNGVNTSLAAPGALAHRLQRRTACNTSPPALSKMANGVPK